MDISEDMKICGEILQQYKNLSAEDGAAALKLSQMALSMYDRLNELRLIANTLTYTGKSTKTDIKEYLRAKMKVMECIHVESRVIFTGCNNDPSRFKRY